MDHDEIGSLIADLYAGISGPAGYKRDWNRLLSLFMPDAKMIRTSIDGSGRPQALVMDLAQYPENVEEKLHGQAFFEMEVQRITERFGNIAHAFSTYEAWADQDRTRFIKRGINSIQLYHDGERWRIVNMIWDDERPDSPMPPGYLAGWNAR